MSRRRLSQPGNDSGNDSFLDILANLVGILVILVVVVAIRVQQTVQVDPETVVAPEPILIEREPIEPQRILLGPDELPINGLFAAPIAEVEAEPSPAARLLAERDGLKTKLELVTPIASMGDAGADREKIQLAINSVEAEIESEKAYLADVRATLAARKAEFEELQREQGRVVAELEEELPTETTVISLQHDVRAIARLSGPDQLYVELAENHLTLLPLKDLFPLLGADLRRKMRTGGSDGIYSGRVGPIRGVSLFYEVPNGGTSPIDELRFGASARIEEKLTFSVNIAPTADSVPIDDAVETNSEFLYQLASSRAGTSVTAFVYPDSFAAARKLQEVLQLRGVRLALQPIPEGVPIIHSPGGAQAMAQ